MKLLMLLPTLAAMQAGSMTMTPGGLDSLWGALAASPGLAAVIVILVMNNRSEERREQIRQKGEQERQSARQTHERELADRYEKLVDEVEGTGREQMKVFEALVGDIRRSHDNHFSQRTRDGA